MKITQFLFPIILGCSSIGLAQNCDCESNYQWTKKTFEENDAGFQLALDRKGLNAYKAHNEKIEAKIKNVKNDMQCTKILYEWLTFFRSGHHGISRLTVGVDNTENFSNESVNIDFKKFEKYISSKKEADLEGIWESKPYLIGIQKINDEYKGFIMKSEAENWKPKDLKLKINADQKTGVYYMGDKSPKPIKNVILLGKNTLKMGNIILNRVSSPFHDNANDLLYAKSITATEPFLEQLNPKTLYLRIPSFTYEEKPKIDKIILENKEKLASTENLIIDLRNNGGGSDNSFQQILPFLYTNPIRTIGVELYSTPLNNERMLDFATDKKYNFSEEQKAFFKKAYEELNQNLGKFVNLGNPISISKMEKILPFPKNIGIIINENNASTTEQFLLAAKQSKKVKLFGTTTAGILDISNMHFVNSPCNDFQLGYSLSKSLRIPAMEIDEKGIQPDYFLDQNIPETEWVNYVNDILNE